MLDFVQARQDLETAEIRMAGATRRLVEQGLLTAEQALRLETDEFARQRTRKLLSWLALRTHADHRQVWALAYDRLHQVAGYHPATLERAKRQSIIDAVEQLGHLPALFVIVKQLFETEISKAPAELQV